MRRPLSPTAALAYVDSWLQQPCVETVAPGERHWPILRRLLEATGSAGNLTSDAHIAALALERGASVCSTDHDFGRFPGIRHVNPLTPAERGPRAAWDGHAGHLPRPVAAWRPEH